MITGSPCARFLKELEVSGNLAFALAASGLTRWEAFAARDADPWFERMWRLAEASARRAFEGRVTGHIANREGGA